MKIPCPKCGADIVYDVNKSKLYCDTCKSYSYVKEFDIEKLYKYNDTYNEYQCGSCGARLVTEKSTILTECAFCNSTQIITKKISGEYKPDYIIPFKIDKESFKEIYFEYVKTFHFLPKSFNKEINLEDIKGVYIPYKRYTFGTKISFKGTKLEPKNGSYERMKVDYEREDGLKIIVDASSKLNDNITSSIEPYKFDCEKPFNPLYLLGFQAEWLDENNNKLENKAIDRAIVCTASHEDLPYMGFTALYTGKATIDIDTIEKPVFYLLPVWLCNVKYGFRKIPVAVNGQTGKIVANFPLDYTKIFLIKLIILIIGIVMLLGSTAFSLKLAETNRLPNSHPILGPLSGILIIISFVIILASIVWDFGLRKNYKSIHSSLNSNIKMLKSRLIRSENTFDFNKKKEKDYLKKPFKLLLNVNGKKEKGRIIKKLVRKSRREYHKTNAEFYYFNK